MLEVGAAGSAHGGRAPSRSLGAEGGCALHMERLHRALGPDLQDRAVTGTEPP